MGARKRRRWAFWRRETDMPQWLAPVPLPDGDQHPQPGYERAAEVLNEPTREFPGLRNRSRMADVNSLTPAQRWRGNGGGFRS
jgi:hypothetical protein